MKTMPIHSDETGMISNIPDGYDTLILKDSEGKLIEIKRSNHEPIEETEPRHAREEDIEEAIKTIRRAKIVRDELNLTEIKKEFKDRYVDYYSGSMSSEEYNYRIEVIWNFFEPYLKGNK